MNFIQIIIEATLILFIFWLTSFTILKRNEITWSIPIFIIASSFVVQFALEISFNIFYEEYIYFSLVFTIMVIWSLLNVFGGEKYAY